MQMQQASQQEYIQVFFVLQYFFNALMTSITTNPTSSSS
jgi:hypothetical protein